MQFSQLIGNEELKHLLPRMVREGRLPHALLFTEEGPWGALPFALALAQYVNCEHPEDEDACGSCDACHKYGKLIHPDLHFAFPVNTAKSLSDQEKKGPVSDYFLAPWRELLLTKPYFSEPEFYDALKLENKSGMITVNEAKRIIEKLSLRSFEGEYKTMVIYLPERMNADAANKLLKLIEEPPAGTLFLLVTHNPERILQTIRSRCQRIQLKPLSLQERKAAGLSIATNPEFSELFNRLLTVSLERKLIDTFPLWESLSEMGRERQRDWCLYAEQSLRNICMVASSTEEIVEMEEEERQRVRDFAKRLRPDFYEKAFKALESLLGAIDSNVNAKLAFCNLCNIFFLSV